MIYCNIREEVLIGFALEYLPPDIQDVIGDKIAIICLQSDAVRLARNIYSENEIVILSLNIFPKGNWTESDQKFRYFVFCILHEIAHAVKKHKSPIFDNLSQQESEDQEQEADQIAIDWFNLYIYQKGHEDLKPITKDEIEEQKKINQQKWANFLN